MSDRPVVHCLIAKALPAPAYFGRTKRVTLATAWVAIRSGAYVAVGPDPQDLQDLARWEREHQED